MFSSVMNNTAIDTRLQATSNLIGLTLRWYGGHDAMKKAERLDKEGMLEELADLAKPTYSECAESKRAARRWITHVYNLRFAVYPDYLKA